MPHALSSDDGSLDSEMACHCAGHYAHAMEMFQAAAEHFSAAAGGAAGAGSTGGVLAAINQSLTVLCDRTPGAVAHATDILKSHALYDSVDSGLPAHQRWACISHQHFQPSNAKLTRFLWTVASDFRLQEFRGFGPHIGGTVIGTQGGGAAGVGAGAAGAGRRAWRPSAPEQGPQAGASPTRQSLHGLPSAPPLAWRLLCPVFLPILPSCRTIFWKSFGTVTVCHVNGIPYGCNSVRLYLECLCVAALLDAFS